MRTLKILLDTDFGNDIDDALVVAMLAHWHKQSKVEWLGAVNSKMHPDAADTLAWFCAYYGMNFSIGECENGFEQPKPHYLALLPELKAEHPEVIPLLIKPATKLIPEILAEQPDNSVEFVMIGNATNLANLMLDTEIAELAHRKIKRITWMAGEFNIAYAENNLRVDWRNSRIAFNKWQGKLELLPSSTGKKVKFAGHRMIDKTDPLAKSYNDYMKRGWGRECWDPLTALYVSGLAPHLFMTKQGTVTLDENTVTVFEPNTNGNHAVIDLVDNQAVRAEALRWITQAVFT